MFSGRISAIIGTNTIDEDYFSLSTKYDEKEIEAFVKMLFWVGNAFSADPRQDFLGSIQIELGVTNRARSQIFTPYHIASLMSKLSFESKIEALGQQEWISMADLCCGCGVMLIAFANHCMEAGINYQEKIVFIGQDVDPIVAISCLIQLTFLGCAGYIAVGDALLHPVAGSGTLLNPERKPGLEIFDLMRFNYSPWTERRFSDIIL